MGETSMNWLFYTILVAGGYAASIYTWPWVRKTYLGAAAEADRLRNRARDMDATLRAKL
jgi:hypothetical protein